jgi:DNA-binding response OmpR family regulator
VRILLTEDNLTLSNLIKTRLGKFHAIDVANNLKNASYFLDTKTYDLLILDLVLPDGNGCDICVYLKENKIILPILFLTAELDLAKKVHCLQSGDDYLAKPFNILELEARIKVLLRKISNKELQKLKKSGLEIDSLSHQAYLDNKEIELNRKEFLLLELFLKYPTQIFSKALLAEKVWQEENVLFGNAIETTIANLRRKIGKNLIKTVKGVGYILKSN